LITATALVAGVATPVAFASGASSTPAPATPVYDIAAVIHAEAGDYGGPVGRGMNETGTIVGWKDYPLEAFSWSQTDGLATLPALSGDTNRTAVDVNDAGVAVGDSGRQTIEPPQHAVRWVNGIPEDLGTLPGDTESHAEGINEAGTIVGWSSAGSESHAFVWTPTGGMVDITPTADLGSAYDVNESGQVTGYADSQAFLWENGVLTKLGVPAGFAYSFGFAINDDGVIAAHVTTASGNAQAVARWSKKTGWEVLGGVGQANVSWGINNDSWIVGRGRPTAGLERGFVYVPGAGLLGLTELLSTSDWTVTYAYDIDDAGRILAQGSNTSTGERATLFLVPRGGAAMHDEGLALRLKGTHNRTTGIADLTVVDQDGAPIGGAVVTGEWARNGTVVRSGATDETGAKGKAELRKRFKGVKAGDVIRFCVTSIDHADYTYDPAAPSCVSATAK
jgi:probable HAF family extracellular repeat protein